MNKKILGVDVAKDTLYFSDINGVIHGEVVNEPKGFRKIITLFNQHEMELVVLEATGGYERQVLYHLAEKGIPVALVESTRVRNHARSAGIFAKTDKLDARVIAHFATCHPPRLYRLMSPCFRKLRAINQRREQVVEMIRQEKTRIDKVCDSYILRSINRILKVFEKELKSLDAKMEKLWSQEKELQSKVKRLQTCPGIGKITATTVVLEFPELGTLSPKEAASLAGLAPMNRDSGKFRGKQSITKGRRRLRRFLYMASVVSVTHNPVISKFFHRLKAKKPGKVALVACMRKLLIYLNAMIRDEVDWRDKSVA